MTSIATVTRQFVVGYRGLVGSAVVRRLRREGPTNLITVTWDNLDLCDRAAVFRWFTEHPSEEVFFVAGTVGGTSACSTRPAECILYNMMTQAAVVCAMHLSGVKTLRDRGSPSIHLRGRCSRSPRRLC